MKYLLVILFVLFFPHFAAAQLLSETPRCVTLYSIAKREMLAQVESATYEAPDGTISQHIQTFRMMPSDSREICSTGPFFDDYKLRLVLKTSFPVFSCYVETGSRLITLQDDVNSNGDKVFKADCQRPQIPTAPGSAGR